jgi:hypothetical protein
MGAGHNQPLTMQGKGGFRQPMRITEESDIDGTKNHEGKAATVSFFLEPFAKLPVNTGTRGEL